MLELKNDSAISSKCESAKSDINLDIILNYTVSDEVPVFPRYTGNSIRMILGLIVRIILNFYILGSMLEEPKYFKCYYRNIYIASF
ncbi:MAG: hypothetical protein LBE09_04725 [Christensenellaceae bacterium]|nr:hypothetical protein [Christensenellaceae bacterium]